MMNTYGLIGFPLKHSFSAKFFTEKFKRENIDAKYLNFEIENIRQIKEVVSANPNLKGLNVTIPYKEQVIPFLDELLPEAEKIGAVNVIKIDRKPNDRYDYHLKGYNTDYPGFKKSIEPLIKPDIHKKALVLGTGGASKAVVQALDDLGIDWKYVSRTPGENKFIYEELTPEIINNYRIIINASPVGTFPNVNECPAIPYPYLTGNHLLYDLVYNPKETLFLKKGKAHGATVKNGEEMLLIQAQEAWRIWTT